MKTSKWRLYLLVTLGFLAYLAVRTPAQVGGGATQQVDHGGIGGGGDAITRHLVVEYEAVGGILGIERQLRVQDNGAATLSETRGGNRADFAGRLESEEVAGLEAALTELFRTHVVVDPGPGVDGFDRALAIWTEEGRCERSGNLLDAATMRMVAWLDEIADSVKSGVRDDAGKYIEAKLARPDRGGHSASGFTVTRGAPREIRWELDESGRRRVTLDVRLPPNDVKAVHAFIRLVDPRQLALEADARMVLADEPSDALAEAFVIRVWDRFDPAKGAALHPFVHFDPGLPTTAIMLYLLLP